MTTEPFPRDVELVLEAATSARRELDSSGRIKPSPAWVDLSPEHREHLFERQLQARRLECAVHPLGLSSTALAIAARIAELPQL
ncbi:MAG: hypothetical protein ACR2RL_11205 [Gammaproteobacteria bacterium]